MAIFDITYIGDMPYLKLTGGTVTGAVTFNNSVTADSVTTTGAVSAGSVTSTGAISAGSLSVSGATSLTGNLQVNTINGVTVGSNPKFTDTVTTISAKDINGNVVNLDADSFTFYYDERKISNVTPTGGTTDSADFHGLRDSNNYNFFYKSRTDNAYKIRLFNTNTFTFTDSIHSVIGGFFQFDDGRIGWGNFTEYPNSGANNTMTIYKHNGSSITQYASITPPNLGGYTWMRPGIGQIQGKIYFCIYRTDSSSTQKYEIACWNNGTITYITTTQTMMNYLNVAYSSITINNKIYFNTISSGQNYIFNGSTFTQIAQSYGHFFLLDSQPYFLETYSNTLYKYNASTDSYIYIYSPKFFKGLCAGRNPKTNNLLFLGLQSSTTAGNDSYRSNYGIFDVVKSLDFNF